MNAVSGKNLSSDVPADEVHVGVTHDTGGALGDVSDEALFCRMTATCIWGVSDPLGTGLGAKKGAAKWGSLTPHLPPCGVARLCEFEHGRHTAPPKSWLL